MNHERKDKLRLENLEIHPKSNWLRDLETTFITISQELNRLSGLRATSSRLLDLLHQRWSDVLDLPLYPAFQTRNYFEASNLAK